MKQAILCYDDSGTKTCSNMQATDICITILFCIMYIVIQVGKLYLSIVFC